MGRLYLLRNEHGELLCFCSHSSFTCELVMPSLLLNFFLSIKTPPAFALSVLLHTLFVSILENLTRHCSTCVDSDWKIRKGHRSHQ